MSLTFQLPATPVSGFNGRSMGLSVGGAFKEAPAFSTAPRQPAYVNPTLPEVTNVLRSPDKMRKLIEHGGRDALDDVDDDGATESTFGVTRRGGGGQAGRDNAVVPMVGIDADLPSRMAMQAPKIAQHVEVRGRELCLTGTRTGNATTDTGQC